MFEHLATEIPPGILWLFVCVLGLCLGSFSTCVLYRVPRGLSVWKNDKGSQRSFCPSCGATLHSIDLIPFFSWAIQGGKCRYCRKPIPIFYPVVELAVLCAVAGLYAWLGFSGAFILASFSLPAFLALGAFIAAKSRRL